MAWHAKPTDWYRPPDYSASPIDYGDPDGCANVGMINSLLNAEHYSIYAIAAIVGNWQGEGGLNPWRWQSNEVPTYQQFVDGWGSSSYHGYGMAGWTPANSYINSTNANYAGFAPNFASGQYPGHPPSATDGHAQTLFFIDVAAANFVNYVADNYEDDFPPDFGFYNYFYRDPVSGNIWGWDSFKSGYYPSGGQIPLDVLAGAFMFRWEKPSAGGTNIVWRARVTWSNNWYQYLTGHPPVPPVPPTPTSRKMPLWMMCLKRRF